MDLKMINSIDNHGFSDLHYAQFWEEDFDKSLQLKIVGANYTTALYQYLSKGNNIRKEVLKIYNRYTDFNIKELINLGYLHYFDETFSYTYNASNDDITEYIKTYQFNTILLVNMIESKNYKINYKLLEIVNTHVSNLYGNLKEEYAEIIEDKENSFELFSYLEKRLKDRNTSITYPEEKYNNIDVDEREEKLKKVIEVKKNINELNTFEIKIKELQRNDLVSFIKSNSLNNIKKIFQFNLDPNFIIDEDVEHIVDVETPLSLAVEKGYHDIVKLLLNNGAKIEITDSTIYGLVLFLAIEHNDLKMVELLIKYKTDIIQSSECAITPLEDAVTSNNFEIVQLLLSHNAQLCIDRALYDEKIDIFIKIIQATDEPKIVNLLIENLNAIIAINIDEILDKMMHEFSFKNFHQDIDIAYNKSQKLFKIISSYYPATNSKIEHILQEINAYKINEDSIPF